MTLYRIGCGMAAPEFSVNHAHDLECYEPIAVNFEAAAKAFGGIVQRFGEDANPDRSVHSILDAALADYLTEEETNAETS